MKVLGYVNRFSRGVYRVQKELEENGNGKASFDFSLITAFRVVEPISTTYFEEGFGEEESDNKLGESTDKLGESTDKLGESTDKTPIKSEELPNKLPNKSGELPKKLEGLPNKSTDKKEESTNKSTDKKEESTNKIEEEILKVIIDNPFYNRKELSEIFGRTEEGIGYYLKKLTKAGIIKREGAKKNGKWVVIDREELEGENN